MNEILKCYRVDEESGKLDLIEIFDYEMRKQYFGKYTYRFKMPSKKGVLTFHTIEDSKLDRFTHGKVFTFKLNEDQVRDVIYEELLRRIQRAKATIDSSVKTMVSLSMKVPKDEKAEKEES